MWIHNHAVLKDPNAERRPAVMVQAVYSNKKYNKKLREGKKKVKIQDITRSRADR